MFSPVQKNILATIAYYDGLNYPLTAFEVWKQLIRIEDFELRIKDEEKNFDLKKILVELDSVDLRSRLEEFRGFYFLRGKKELVEKRIKGNKIACSKIKRLRKTAFSLRFVPFVRMVAVTGKLAMKNANKKSDWDLLIALKSGKIWTGRFLVSTLLHLIGKRRHGGKIKDRICLNYFLTEKSLEIEKKDLFSSGEYFFAFPLFGEKLFKEFQEKNSWIADFKANYDLEENRNLKIVKDSVFSKKIRSFGEFIFSPDFLENLLRKIEKEKIQKNPLTFLKGSYIKASNQSLIFLPKPQGPEVVRKFREKISEWGIK